MQFDELKRRFPAGVASFRSLEDLLRQPDGKGLSIPEAVRHFGYRNVWVAALNSYVREHLGKRKLHGYPPKIFISYKLQDDAHKRWAQSVTDAFRDAGYEVLLDQYDLTVKNHMDVPAYVASIAESHYVVMIVTAQYLEMGTWVFDEINMAVSLKAQGLTRNIALVRDVPKDMSDPVATLITRLGCHPDDLHFMESISDPYSFIQRTFPFDGLRYDAEQKKRLMALRDEGEALIDSGKFRAAAEKINDNPDPAESIEVQTLIALVCAKGSSNKQLALDSARRLIASHAINSSTRLRLSEVFRDCGQHREALQTLSPVRGQDAFGPSAAYLYGVVLDDLGAYEAALNHLQYSRLKLGDKPTLLNDLGVVYKNSRDFPQAERYFRRALELQPENLGFQANLAAVLLDLHQDAEANKMVERGQARFPRFAESVAPSGARPGRAATYIWVRIESGSYAATVGPHFRLLSGVRNCVEIVGWSTTGGSRAVPVVTIRVSFRFQLKLRSAVRFVASERSRYRFRSALPDSALLRT
jgi:tetratricopeptide (TPR) repeat protein